MDAWKDFCEAGIWGVDGRLRPECSHWRMWETVPDKAAPPGCIRALQPLAEEFDYKRFLHHLIKLYEGHDWVPGMEEA